MKASLIAPCAALMLALGLGGCAGYRVGSVGGKNIQGVSTIYVPVIHNATLEPGMDVPTTSAIIRAFDQEGTLKTSGTNAADAELTVTIVSIGREQMQTEYLDVSSTTQLKISVSARVTCVNRRTGKKIVDNAEVSGVNSYFVGRDQVEAERQALPIAEQDLAKRIVALVVEGW
ncbi:Lipopolysaccharide-assembly [Verrucomicrobium sp. GAS474]|uniref:LPS assembly lipoprotein LptE n=1 Tax=Verrucomicrobium sp. GAS474 TaxID=1882831 RepID=UPI00087D54DF|nr:LptE family protein [Verrucomicrobium sp. GAS474]SDU22972.1 Lipopolysaccharide-assembly [Verrucomicrobium sp. GAS474]